MTATTAPARPGLPVPPLDVDAFSYVVAHDLKSPLRAVHLFARLLEERLADRLDAEEREHFQTVRAELERLNDRIDGVRRIAQAATEPGEGASTDAREAVLEAWSRIEGGSRHHLLVDGALPRLPVPPLHAAAVVRALLQNAVVHHPGVATVTVRGGRGRGAAGGVWLEVCDDGPGLPAPLEDLVRPFHARLHVPDGAGPGVGLALCNHVLAHHGGRLREGTVLGGACIRVEFV